MWQTRIHNNEQTENQQNIKEHFPLKGNNLQLCFVFITFSFYYNMLTSVFLKKLRYDDVSLLWLHTSWSVGLKK